MFRLEVDKEINLVFLQNSMAPELYALVESNRDYLHQWMPWVEGTTSVADIESFIERSVNGFAKEATLVCAIEYKGKLGGIISYNKISKTLKKVELGYWLAEALQGNGIIYRACKKLIDYAFHEMNMEKAEIRVVTGNLASRKVCEKLGGTLEGEISHSENLHGNIAGHAVYAIHNK
ncbi:MAG: GNAT family N-acetyltransferase [Gammaproteobacteria bacterium]|nr:GNAT family N-acetyltransferase [Gammaproteobacteria bacterium]